jgi:hypothetical protein
VQQTKYLLVAERSKSQSWLSNSGH